MTLEDQKQDGITRKRLYYDIETSPNIGLFWRSGYSLNIGPENIIQERAIICISYKWEGEEVNTLTWDSKQSDKSLLKKFSKLLFKATEIVAHNGDKFDVKWVKGRCLYHQIEVPHKLVTIDTCKQARKHFNLNSNKLDYIGQFLGVGQKHDTGGFDLWKRILLEKDKDAMKTMVEYCEQDVILLERVYQKMKNYIDTKMHYGTLHGEHKYTCPECGSSKVRCRNTRTSAMGTIKRQMKCKDCHKMYTISNKSYMQLVIDRRENRA